MSETYGVHARGSLVFLTSISTGAGLCKQDKYMHSACRHTDFQNRYPSMIVQPAEKTKKSFTWSLCSSSSLFVMSCKALLVFFPTKSTCDRDRQFVCGDKTTKQVLEMNRLVTNKIETLQKHAFGCCLPYLRLLEWHVSL